MKTDTAEPLPNFVSVFIGHNGRRRVDVPTDVEQLDDSGIQIATNAADGILVASPSFPLLRGTGAVCCLVRLKGHVDLFVLSCHHVLTLSSNIGGCQVVRDTVVADRKGIPYAQLFDYFPMAPNLASQVDAAIALVGTGQALDWNHNGVQPRAIDMGLSKPKNCSIYAPGRRLNAAYVKTWPEVRLPYPGCTVQIECAYQFMANTRPGDSGSPVIGSDGTLYGMHFWGSPSTNFALSIPAGYLFRSGVFGSGEIELA